MSQTKLVAVVGGSGAGKTWLADRLQRELGANAGRLSLDDFYFDLSHRSEPQRAGVNFDDPRAVDWTLFETILRGCRAGQALLLPRYDFSTHTRMAERERWRPPRLVVVDGLWLLHESSLAALFDLRVYLDCPEHVRWCRRLARDVTERGRSPESVREQFWRTVAPMHERVVAPQEHQADLVVREPISQRDFDDLVGRIRGLDTESSPGGAPAVSRPHTRTSTGSTYGPQERGRARSERRGRLTGVGIASGRRANHPASLPTWKSYGTRGVPRPRSANHTFM